jgi:hypothetical protein
MQAFIGKMTDLAAIICPHSSVPEKKLKAILSFFGSVKIGRPWFTDQPVPLPDSGAVQLLYPPENLKPLGDFRRLLAEYRGWVRTNHDKGFDAFLAFKEQKLQGEEATWEIRGELRHKERQPREARRQHTLKWHLFLHLAQEIEEGGQEAEELLRTLKEQDSPLKGAIEEEGEPPGPLADLPGFDGSPILTEAGMNQVMEAWFSLFEEHLRGKVVLLTLSPPIFQHLCEAWEEWGGGTASADMEFRVPDFSRFDLTVAMKERDRFLDSKEGVAVRKAVVNFLKGNSGMHWKEMGGIDSEGLTGERISIRLRHFSPLMQSFGNEILRHLSGKTIGLIREEHSDGQ